jgi:hypothetical protein
LASVLKNLSTPLVTGYFCYQDLSSSSSRLERLIQVALPRLYAVLPFESNKKVEAGLTLLKDQIFAIISEKRDKMKDGEGSGKI